jgi:hypothetical protein
MAGDREKTAGEAAKEKAEKAKPKAGDREKTAAEAAKEKVERREEVEEAQEEAVEEVEAEEKAEKKKDPRSSQEKEEDLAAGTIETSNLTETGPDSGKSPEELRAEVEAAREELADTVTELGRKVDPRPNVEAAAEKAKARANVAADTARSNAVPIAVGAGFLLVLLIWLRRR